MIHNLERLERIEHIEHDIHQLCIQFISDNFKFPWKFSVKGSLKELNKRLMEKTENLGVQGEGETKFNANSSTLRKRDAIYLSNKKLHKLLEPYGYGLCGTKWSTDEDYIIFELKEISTLPPPYEKPSLLKRLFSSRKKKR